MTETTSLYTLGAYAGIVIMLVIAIWYFYKNRAHAEPLENKSSGDELLPDYNLRVEINQLIAQQEAIKKSLSGVVV